MAWPHTPLTTFSENTVPKVSAAFLNSLQQGVNAVAYPQYTSRPEVRMRCTNGSSPLLYVSPITILDNATSKYRYVSFPTIALSPGAHMGGASTWTSDVWHYIYAKCTNGVYGIEVSTTAPVVFGPDGNITATPLFEGGPVETRRYLGCFRTQGTDVINFSMQCGEYSFLTETMDGSARRIVSSASGNTLYQNVSISGFAPPHAYRLDVVARLLNGEAGSSNNLVVNANSDPYPLPLVVVPQGTPNLAESYGRVPLLGGTTIKWKTGTANCAVFIWGAGFAE